MELIVIAQSRSPTGFVSVAGESHPESIPLSRVRLNIAVAKIVSIKHEFIKCHSYLQNHLRNAQASEHSIFPVSYQKNAGLCDIFG